MITFEIKLNFHEESKKFIDSLEEGDVLNLVNIFGNYYDEPIIFNNDLRNNIRLNNYYCFFNGKYVEEINGFLSILNSNGEIILAKVKKQNIKTKDCFLDEDIVQTVEGGIFKIGDKVKFIKKTKNPVFKNKNHFIIKRFRWTNDNSKICAVVSNNFPNGIGLDKLEIYFK